MPYRSRAMSRENAIRRALNPRLLASLTRLHIVAIAMLAALTFGWLLTGSYSFWAMLLVGFDWFLVNLLNRPADLKEDQKNNIYGSDFVGSHGRGISMLGVALLLSSFALTVTWSSPLTHGLRVGFHALGAAYNWRVLPGRKRIKELYFWKNLASAVGFLITVFGYPLSIAQAALAFPPGITTTGILAFGIFFLFFELSYEVIYDLRDQPGDAENGVRTYAVVHGVKTATTIAYSLSAAGIVVLAVSYGAALIPWRLFVMLVAPIIQIAGLRWATKNGITSAYCIGITWLGAALLLTYNLWALAGLPGVGL